MDKPYKDHFGNKRATALNLLLLNIRSYIYFMKVDVTNPRNEKQYPLPASPHDPDH